MKIVLSAKERVKIKIRLSFCRAHYEEVISRGNKYCLGTTIYCARKDIAAYVVSSSLLVSANDLCVIHQNA